MVLLALAVSCDVQTACPNDLPATCVSPAPVYGDVAPVFEAHCVRCHGSGGPQASRPLDTWAAISATRAQVLSQVYGCRMPPIDEADVLTPSERALVLHWLVCGAPGP